MSLRHFWKTAPLTLSDSVTKELQETARYPEPPWFATTMIIGGVVVAIGSSGTTLEVSRLGASAIL
jgi:hypothetical protein